MSMVEKDTNDDEDEFVLVREVVAFSSDSVPEVVVAVRDSSPATMMDCQLLFNFTQLRCDV